MFSRALLVLFSAFVCLPAVAAPPSVARDVLFKTWFPEIKIEAQTPEDAVYKLAMLYHEMKPGAGDLNMVLIDEPGRKPKPFKLSEVKLSLQNVIFILCEHYGWSRAYTEETLVLGPKDRVDRFLEIYKTKRWPLEKSVIIPKMYWFPATLKEAAWFLNKRAGELDPDGKWQIQALGDTSPTACLFAENIAVGEAVQLFAAAIGREPEQAFDGTRLVRATDHDSMHVARPAISDVTFLRCVYWRAFHEEIEIRIRRKEDGTLLLRTSIHSINGKPSQRKEASEKVIAPQALAPVLEFVNAAEMRNAFANEGTDDRLDGSFVELTIKQKSLGLMFESQDVFASDPAVKDARMRKAVEALFKLAELEFEPDDLY